MNGTSCPEGSLRWRHAVHEAGHLLLGLRRGRTLKAVTVNPDGRSEVRMDYPSRLDALNDPMEPLQARDIELGAEEILIKWGGYAAEYVTFPNVIGDSQDRRDIEALANRLGIPNSKLLCDQAVREVLRERELLHEIAMALVPPTPPTIEVLTALVS